MRTKHSVPSEFVSILSISNPPSIILTLPQIFWSKYDSNGYTTYNIFNLFKLKEAFPNKDMEIGDIVEGDLRVN